MTSLLINNLTLPLPAHNAKPHSCIRDTDPSIIS